MRRVFRLAVGATLLGALACGSSEPWVDARGEVGAREVERDYRDHCEWGSATFLQMSTQTYVRDPRDVVTEKSGPYLAATELPPDATYTRIHRSDTEIWRSPAADPEAIFVVFPDHAERWPLTGAACVE